MSADYNGIIPKGLDIIELPESKYLIFKGKPFKKKDYAKVIEQAGEAIRKYVKCAL